MIATALLAGNSQSLFAEAFNVQTAMQNNGIRGTVIDENGETVIGASVIVKGTTNGTITDFEGRFVLNNVPKGSTLLISYVGYRTQEIKVSNQASIQIVLKEDSEMLEEVVVVGFGTQKKINLTGSVGIATAEDLKSRPVTTATQALQGVVPGLNITTNSGQLDNTMSINIRGEGTIGSGSSGSPLILIDGMEGDINTINPQDIENISVLKDAAASSIYGSRAPFGVILVTTKKGKSGKASINYNNSFRIVSPVHLPEMMDSYTFANFFNEASTNSGWGQVFTDETMQKMLDFQAAGGTNRGGLLTDGKVWGKPAGDPFTTGYANTDWFKELYKGSSFSHEHNLSASGGSEKVTYYASLGYLAQNGLLRHGDDELKRYNASAKINAELTPWLDFSYGMRFVRTDYLRPTAFGDGLYLNIGRQTWPNMPVYDENGYYHNGNATGPAMVMALGGDRTAQTDRLYHQAALIIEPIKNWKTHFEFNYSTFFEQVREVSLPCYNHDVNGNIVDTNGTSSLYQTNKKENFMNLNIYSEYDLKLNDVHNFRVMVGFQSEEMKQSFNSAKGYGLLLEELAELNLISNQDGSGNTKVPEVSGYRHEWATAGFFGRLNYDYDGKYLVEANLRYDGTSRFRRGSRWNLSPSFSLGWNIAREAFWESIEPIVGTLKLRASYGELGNQNTTGWYPTYRTMSLGSASGYWVQDGVQPNTASVGGLISTSLTWETVRSYNIGLDWGLFNNRLTGSFDYYHRYTDNMVGPAPELPATLGVSAPSTNNCDLKTAGWELSIAWNDRLKNGLRYGAKFVLADAQTTIESYPSNTTLSINTYYKGAKLGQIWGYETIGIAKTQEEMDAHLTQVGGQPFGTEWGAGDIMYKDLDGKEGISSGASTLNDHGDLKVIGNNKPRFQFGLDLTADWKGFDVRAFFQGVMKRDIWIPSNMFWGVVNNQWMSMGLAEHNDYFRDQPIGLEGHEIEANLDSYYPRPLFSSNKNQQKQTRYLQDASYIRLKNLQIGYTLPRSLMKKIGLSQCRVFVSGENLWTGTSLSKIFDPETVDGGSNDSSQSEWLRNSGNAYPLVRTWSFGLSLTL
ncbi:MAG: TonB-dependent receptor [Bacteroides sp.]|nr:TonB-dependent receptor [Bacteroides sp.]